LWSFKAHRIIWWRNIRQMLMLKHDFETKKAYF
jgi:hypothetical protein